MKKTIGDVNKFIKESGVEKIVSELKSKLEKDGQMPVYSDIYKNENGKTYQYVNYVQEGGGVLGVALAGYTYVLEKLGFRFIKLAGTSAGAINTILLAAINKENYGELKDVHVETKSELVLYELLNKSLWDLVDGSKFGKWLIALAVNNKRRLSFLLKLLVVSLFIPLLYVLLKFILFVSGPCLAEQINSIVNYVTYAAIVILVIYTILVAYYLYRFDRAHFGINPGNNFYDWIKDILKRNNINNTSDLDVAMEKTFEGFELRPNPLRTGLESTTKITQPYLTIITSDITNQMKVEFPKMASEYWDEKTLPTISPACFVRASMSIPVFFAPFRVTVNQTKIESSALQEKGLVSAQFHKMKSLERNLDSYEVHFVDGGILSNFPISVFHNPAVKMARMPTFGAKLEDTTHMTGEEVEKSRVKFFPFLYKIFNTIRYNYDRDFLKKNAVYEQCIGHIDVASFNWLNFGIDDKTKMDLFKEGAQAAKTFLLGGKVWIKGRENTCTAFDWEKFKKERMEV